MALSHDRVSRLRRAATSCVLFWETTSCMNVLPGSFCLSQDSYITAHTRLDFPNQRDSQGASNRLLHAAWVSQPHSVTVLQLFTEPLDQNVLFSRQQCLSEHHKWNCKISNTVDRANAFHNRFLPIGHEDCFCLLNIGYRIPKDSQQRSVSVVSHAESMSVKPTEEW